MDYWDKQNKQPLYKDLDFARPEQKQRAGKLTIIGGSSGSFRTVASCASLAENLGPATTVVLPDSLKKIIPASANITFADSEASGGFAKSALPTLKAASSAADFTLLIGDLGKNSETVVAISELAKSKQKLLITRDSIDLITPEAPTWLEAGEETSLLITLSQLQKLFRTVYYPRIIALSMPTNQLIETLHKFTITFPVTIATTHNGQYITAKNGQITTTDLADTTYNPLSIWQGDFATKIATYNIWNPDRPQQVATSSILAFAKITRY